ncbi:hypothetical protein THRCLA_06373 [Thraustotheca clavata]|uniref:Uncharacterized protein n=1 Tax=Thraustotheca clavata TaxID=74557 RepID=A0A1V9ZPG5_9STRA|nr:hypothetical protein THRCLA_06373 [Thraustotheca clavata]
MLKRQTDLTSIKDHQEEWEKAVKEGISCLTQIANALQKGTFADGQSWGVLMDASALHDELRNKLEREAHHSQHRLVSLIDRLALLVAQMRHSCFYEALPIPEATWMKSEATTMISKYQYESYLQEIVAMYEQELFSKTLIAQDILDCPDYDTATMYIASWQMQPYVDKARQIEILKLLCIDANPKKLSASSTHKLVK